MSLRKIKNRILTRNNAKLGKKTRAEIQKNGLFIKDECGIADPTAAAAFKNIAFPKKDVA